MARNSASCMSDAMIRKKKTFYDQGDAKLIFSDGEEIKVNKSLLAFNCEFFDKVFFGRDAKKEFYVKDFDSATFVMFLDCLMGFRDYNDLDALLIFPIAHKYQAEESLKQCIEVLRPSTMNQTVCITLNLAIYYECEELVDDVMFFLQDKFNIQSLLETDEYCFLLEPYSMAKLVENIEIDSCLLKTICNWAENYLRKSQSNKKPGTVISFLREHKILNKIREFNFESFQSIFDFREAKETKDLFTQEQLWSFLKDKIVIDSPRKFPNSSAWVSVKKGETLTETFSYVKPLDLSLPYHASQATIQVWRNETIFTNAVPAGENPISCQISFTYAYWQNQNSYMYTNNSSQTYSLNENNILKKDKKFIYEIVSPVSASLLLAQTFNIVYTFNVNCRVLKTSLDDAFSNNNKALYYTYAITKK